MPKFKYKAHNTVGKVFEGEMEDVTAESVGSKLRNDMGMFVLKIEQVESSSIQAPAATNTKTDILEDISQWTPPQGATVKAGAIHPPAEDDLPPPPAAETRASPPEPKRSVQSHKSDAARDLVKTNMEKLSASLRILKDIQDHPGQVAVGDKTWKLINDSVPGVVGDVVKDTIKQAMMLV